LFGLFRTATLERDYSYPILVNQICKGTEHTRINVTFPNGCG
jgi:hypothetical protein